MRYLNARVEPKSRSVREVARSRSAGAHLRAMTTLLLCAALAGCVPAPADPNLQIEGWDDGLPNCAGLVGLFARLYIGGPIQPARPMDERFTTAPVGSWCNSNIGYSTETYGPDGVTLSIPRTDDGPFHNNAEIIAEPAFVPGMTMTYQIDGFDWRSLNGSFGFGASNRTIDYPNLEIAWFMRNDTTGPEGAASQDLAPLFHLLGTEFPRGFFLMVKREGEIVPRFRQIDPELLSGSHSYSVRLHTNRVDFLVDGELLETFADPPRSAARDASGFSVPLVGQLWIDAGYWFPIPWPQFNSTGHSVTLRRYVQGPLAVTPTNLAV